MDDFDCRDLFAEPAAKRNLAHGASDLRADCEAIGW